MKSDKVSARLIWVGILGWIICLPVILSLQNIEASETGEHVESTLSVNSRSIINVTISIVAITSTGLALVGMLFKPTKTKTTLTLDFSNQGLNQTKSYSK